MHILLDHITALLVGAILLGALLMVQFRGQQSAVEASQRYEAQTRSSGLSNTFERELENAQSRAVTTQAFAVGRGGAAGTDLYRLVLDRKAGADGDSVTSRFAFPTLSDPAILSSSPAMIVTYVTTDTGERARIDGRDRPLYTLTRYEYVRGAGVRQTGVFPGVVDFDVTAIYDDGSTELEAALTETPSRFRVEIETAPFLSRARSGGQTIPHVASVRNARTVRVMAAGALSLPTPPDLKLAGGIPALPGDPGFVLPRAPAPGGTKTR